MAKLNDVVIKMQKLNTSIDKICEIKTYLPTQEKFKFIDEYTAILKNKVDENPNYGVFVAFVFFNLMVVKFYTNIELELTYEEFDVMQEIGMINKIASYIGEDYNLLLKMTQMDS